MRSWRLIGVAPFIAGCTSSTVPSCPPIVEYSPQFEAATATELAALPPGSHVARMVADYARERAELRACQAVKAKSGG